MVGCSCIPPPASLQPRKIYNILVPDVFPLQPPKLDEPIAAGTKRKMGKLEEYLQKNPGKAAKVSRRLTRRIKHALYNKQYGYVKIAVHTYIYLLAKSTEPDSRYTFSYFAKELIQQPDTVVQTLLSYPDDNVKCMGAELLANYIKPQNEVEHQAESLEGLVSEACDLAERAKGDAVKVACLRAVHEYMGLCYKLKTLPPIMDKIEALVLRQLDSDPVPSLGEVAAKGVQPAAVATTSSALDGGFSGAMGIASSVPQGTRASDLARSVLLQFRPFLQDISTVYRVIDTLFHYLDTAKKWQDTATVERLMGLVQSSCSDQPFPLFSALMRHTSAPSLSPDDRAMVVKLALRQETVYSLSAFSMALQELPRACVKAENSTALYGVVQAAIAKLALAVGDASQMCEAISSVLRQHVEPGPQAEACLRCALHAVRCIPSFPEVGRTFPGGLLPAHLLQQLAAMIIGWRSSAPEARSLASELLVGVLPCCGAGVRDEKQALGLLTLVNQMSRNAALGTPQDVVVMDKVLQACTGAKRPEVLVQCVRLARVLLTEALALAGADSVTANAPTLNVVAGPDAANTNRGSNYDADADRLWSCAQLMLVNALIGHLVKGANCMHLQSARLNVPPEACPSLKEEAGGLVAVSPVFEGSRIVAYACLQATAGDWPVDRWYGKIVDAACKGSLLQTHYSFQLQNVIFEPFSAHSIPGLPATQHIMAPQPANAGMGPSPSGRDIAPSLTSKLESLARSRMTSLRRERVNLKHVMDMLGADGGEDGKDGADDDDDAPMGMPARSLAPAMSGVSSYHSAQEDVLSPDAIEVQLRIEDVLKVVMDAESAGAAAVVGQVGMDDLMQRLQAVTG